MTEKVISMCITQLHQYWTCKY